MGISFFPKVVKFFDLFNRQQAILKEAAVILDSIFKDFNDIPSKCEKINQLEIQGDLISREIATELSQTFITPLDREDIHAINMAQEDLLNAIRAISSRIGLYRFDSPEQAAVDLVENIRLIVEETEKMLAKLGGRKELQEHSRTAHDLQNESKLQLLVVLGALYESLPEGPEGLLHLVKWTQIYDRIEQALERADSLANIIEGISIKNA
ncbi:MAG: DUF47 family protein [Deltaproteobacteria bacterium]|nr:DUF47 family protein [Deltaproteobacteria bacterium]